MSGGKVIPIIADAIDKSDLQTRLELSVELGKLQATLEATIKGQREALMRYLKEELVTVDNQLDDLRRRVTALETDARRQVVNLTAMVGEHEGRLTAIEREGVSPKASG